MKTLEQIAQEVAGKFCFAHSIGEAKNELQYVILTALQQREQDHEAQRCLLCANEHSAGKRIYSMMHVGEYKCFECKNWLCHEHALQHFSGGRRTRPLQCEQLDIANEVIAAHEAQVAEWVARFSRCGEMLCDPIGGDFQQIEEAIRDVVAELEGARIEKEESDKSHESQVASLTKERDDAREDVKRPAKNKSEEPYENPYMRRAADGKEYLGEAY